MTVIRILPLRTGWDPAPDGTDDYPPDLPAAWRLAYFANVFWGVLVPSRVWRGAGPEEAAAWLADTPPRFRFYLELERADLADQTARLAVVLGDRLAGWVAPAPVLGTLPGAAAARLIQLTGEAAQADRVAGSGLAWVVPPPLVKDLRGARDWLEARVHETRLAGTGGTAASGLGGAIPVLLGACRFEDLGRWQSMLELMGWS